jgi:hypothetical protein
MKAIEKKKLTASTTLPCQIEGISIGDGCLMYPHPETAIPIPLNSLSTGQWWPIALRIFSENNKGRLTSVFITNLREMDEDNIKALFDSADSMGIQLIITETVLNNDDLGTSIILKDDTEKVLIKDGEIIKK